MATNRVAYSTLKLKLNIAEPHKIVVGEKEIEVKQYLPVNEKLALIGRVLTYTVDENDFANPIKIEVVTNIEILSSYTGIAFTEKQKEDISKLYDVLETNDVINKVIAEIPEHEYQSVITGIEETLESYYKYTNSIRGIINSAAEAAQGLNIDMEKIQETITNKENLTLLKDVMTKLG